ncbi:MAG: aminopeptidase [Patescibacteria group bacterium]
MAAIDKNSNYVPDQKILERYAEVLVNYALNSGKGIKKDEVVQCVVPDVAKPMAVALQKVVLQAGGHPMIRLLPTGLDKDFYTLANEQQLKFFPKKFIKARVELIDHNVAIIADPDPMELSSVDPQKIILARDAKKEYRDWLNAKENAGKFTWTAALWGVEAKAQMVGLSLEEYWQQIIQACFLDKKDPVAEWRKVTTLQNAIMKKLNLMQIETVWVEGPDVELQVKIGEKRAWRGGSGRNIPSFEIFTSPDWRGTNGWIRYNQPLYRYGNIIEDIRLEFKNGLVVAAKARRGDKFLQQMLKSKNADKIGEFSLTDNRMSRITHPMAETLFDENMGGPFGNTHLAIGMSYQDCYEGDPTKLSKKDWARLGYNDAAEHTDMVSTTNRTVTATLKNGTTLVIYKDGRFII